MAPIDQLALLSLEFQHLQNPLREHGVEVAAMGLSVADWLNCYVGLEQSAEIHQMLQGPRFARWMAWVDNHGAILTWPGRSDYPDRILQFCEHAPTLLYLGTPVWGSRQVLSVVGSRNPSPQALIWMNRHLVTLFRECHLATASGGARGIDQRTHALSLLAQTPTISFQPGGLINLYPPNFASMAREIVESGGCVVSQFAPDAPMYKGHFHQRNRLIAGLSNVLLVVEANLRSGSLMTGRYGLELGIDVATLPTSPVQPSGHGNLQLLKEGAQMVRDSKDLSVLLGSLGVGGAFHHPDTGDCKENIDRPDGNARRNKFTAR